MTAYSHSRISCFEDCPKKYELQYLVKAPKGPTGIEAFIGSRVHETLERLYRDVSMTRLPTLEEVLQGYRAGWEEAFAVEQPVIRRAYTAEEYRAVGEKALSAYYERYSPFDGGSTIGLEMKVGIDLGEGHTLMGYVDRVTRVADGRWEVHDYKTGSHLPTQAEADSDRQLALYQIALQEAYPEARDVELVWHYVAHDTEVRSRRTPEQLEALRRETLARVLEMEAAEDFPPKESGLCGWCDFKAVCPLFAHEAALAGLSEEDLAAEPVVGLVDRYAEVSGRLSALKREKEALEEELRGRALAQGLAALYGTEQRVKVTPYTGILLPAKGEPERERLEAVLRDAGLWEAFSDLSSPRLSSALQGGDLPEDLAEALGGLVRVKESARLSLGKRGGQEG